MERRGGSAQGGLSLDYEASGRAVSTRLQLEDAGSLLQVFDAPASSFVAIFLAALEIWPETTWGMLAPHAYFVHQRTFPDRRSIGWIGFCPHPLRATDFRRRLRSWSTFPAVAPCC